MTDTTPTSPRAIACTDCRAPAYTACKRIKPGRKVQIQYLKSFHAARTEEFNRLVAAARAEQDDAS